jgi:hypothetical protein
MKTLLILTVGQTDVQLVKDNRRHKLDGDTCGRLHDEIKQRSWSLVDTPGERSRDIINTLPGGDLVLCTPKVDALLAKLGSSQSLTALVLETNREGPRDPRLAGEIVERRLRDRGAEAVERVAFLIDGEQLEDPACDLDAVVRREVVKRLSDAISTATKKLTSKDRVFVATTGGLAAANELVNELVRLHCVGGPMVTALEVPDAYRGGHDDRAVEEKFHPAAGIRARWHALDLIQKGNLLAAWGAVSHIENQPGQEWTQVVRWLADFAASLPIAQDCDIAVLKHPTMAVRAALRVELALRAGDIPRAVHGTVAFFEAALWDWLRQRDFVKEDNATAGNLSDGFTFANQPDGNRFRLKDGKWFINDFRGGQQAWVGVLNKPALTAYFNALTDDIRNLRHDVAHNEPTQALMQQAQARMQGADLWSTNNPLSFMSQPLVQEVLRELGEQDPKTLHTQLIEDIRSRLLTISG